MFLFIIIIHDNYVFQNLEETEEELILHSPSIEEPPTILISEYLNVPCNSYVGSSVDLSDGKTNQSAVDKNLLGSKLRHISSQAHLQPNTIVLSRWYHIYNGILYVVL